MSAWRAWMPELVSIVVIAAAALVISLLSISQHRAVEKSRKKVEGLLATQIAAAGRLVQHSPAPESTLVNDTVRVRLRALRAAHHMLSSARVDLSTILLQRLVANEDDLRQRHQRLSEMGLALGEAELAAKRLGGKSRPTQAEVTGFLVDYHQLLDSASKGLATPILFPMEPHSDSARWPALDSAARALTRTARVNPMEILLSTPGPLEILTRILFALLFVALGGGLLHLFSRLLRHIDAKAQIERIIESQSGEIVSTVATSLSALKPLGLAAGLATGYAASEHATEPTINNVQTITSVMVSIDTSTNRVVPSDTLADAILRSIGNLGKTIDSLKGPMDTAFKQIGNIEENAK